MRSLGGRRGREMRERRRIERFPCEQCGRRDRARQALCLLAARGEDEREREVVRARVSGGLSWAGAGVGLGEPTRKGRPNWAAAGLS